MKGVVFSIEEFSVFDGPGIRSTVFLKGCPLACEWCHNPEGQGFGIETFNAKVIGKEYSIDELCSKLLKNADIFSFSGGGVTFSGGEPLMQSEFLIGCLKNLNGKVNRAIQTSGYASERIFSSVLEHCDYILYDLKIIDCDLHKKYTGKSNETILKNYLTLVNSGVNFTTRVPLIPTVTDTKENLTKIANLLAFNNVKKVELLPYNKMAGGKYKLVGKTYLPSFDGNIEPNPRTEAFENLGISVKIM
ncbi:MAG: radical SAM protein [Clostridiales bacterium]|nr:radical SAM protein [Clostridiales bacterium]